MSQESIKIILDRLDKIEDRLNKTQNYVFIGVGIVSTVAFLAGIFLR